jgi:hypothetical protein
MDEKQMFLISAVLTALLTHVLKKFKVNIDKKYYPIIAALIGAVLHPALMNATGISDISFIFQDLLYGGLAGVTANGGYNALIDFIGGKENATSKSKDSSGDDEEPPQ